jgi:hypothetical protein
VATVWQATFSEFILSAAEGLRMTAATQNCHFERSEKSFLRRLFTRFVVVS